MLLSRTRDRAAFAYVYPGCADKEIRDSPEAPAIALNLFAISRDPRARSSSTRRLRHRASASPPRSSIGLMSLALNEPRDVSIRKRRIDYFPRFLITRNTAIGRMEEAAISPISLPMLLSVGTLTSWDVGVVCRLRPARVTRVKPVTARRLFKPGIMNGKCEMGERAKTAH